MDLLIDILLDAGKDTLSLVPFLLVTYLALETLEHVAGDRVNGAIKRAGAAGPVVGSLLGMVPQCGFSAMAATLYAGRVVTLGTLVAVFLSTSDEMLPLLLAEQVPVQTMAMLLASKALIALVTGFIVDAAIRGLRRNARAHAAIRRTVLGTAANPAHVNCAHDDHSGGDIIDEVAEAGVSAGTSTSCASATIAGVMKTRTSTNTDMATITVMRANMNTMMVTVTLTPTKGRLSCRSSAVRSRTPCRSRYSFFW